ncbi:MAG TPA: peptide ABC transporter permease [Firmicutes bacterium]|nr:peptide ABC transporter permease [Bacillota bacterium]
MQKSWLKGSLLVAVMVLITVAGFFYTPYPPNQMNIQRPLEPPDSEHLLGTDNFGRDIFSRIMVGGRPAFEAGMIAVLLGLTLGTIWGAAAGYFRGWLEEILMRMADGLYSLPSVLMALLAVTLLGPGQASILVAVSLANIPIFARLTRSLFLSLREREHVLAARAIGSSDSRIIFRHILPNCLSTLLVQASISFAAAVLAEASLSYLGLGTQPPDASWGRMLKEAQGFAGLAPWAAIFPGLAIALTVLGFNRLGDGLRDRLDPKL